MNKHKGISLIVLIITIVVVIILATAIIMSLDGDDPIDAAERAVEANDIAVIKEAVGIANAQYRLSDRSKTKQQYIEDYLNEQNLVIPDGYVIENGKLVTMDKSEQLEKPVALYDIANIGDYVDYPVPYTNVTIDGKKEIKTGWRVIAKYSNNVYITSAGLPESVNLSGLTGYDNANNLLNKNMHTYINPSYALSSRSIKLSDIEDIVELVYGYPHLDTPVSNTIALYDLIILRAPYWFNDKEVDTGQKFVDFSNPSGLLDGMQLAFEGDDVSSATYGARPVIQLKINLLTNGKNKKGAWILV